MKRLKNFSSIHSQIQKNYTTVARPLSLVLAIFENMPANYDLERFNCGHFALMFYCLLDYAIEPKPGVEITFFTIFNDMGFVCTRQILNADEISSDENLHTFHLANDESPPAYKYIVSFK